MVAKIHNRMLVILHRADYEILDRFLHHAHVIAITGRSYRVKDVATPGPKKGRKAKEMLDPPPAQDKPTADKLSRKWASNDIHAPGPLQFKISFSLETGRQNVMNHPS